MKEKEYTVISITKTDIAIALEDEISATEQNKIWNMITDTEMKKIAQTLANTLQHKIPIHTIIKDIMNEK